MSDSARLRADPAPPLLEVRTLKKYFPVLKGVIQRRAGWVKAVDDVSFSVQRGETLGLAGESGCGKTTTGRCILRALEPTEGAVWFSPDSERVELTALSRRELKPLRREMQMIFQDPYSSLNARMTVRDLVAEPLVIHRVARGRELDDRVAELLEQVGLSREHLNRYPHAFSGGQRQRIGIARALALRPKFIVADEPVSALDVSVQAQVLNLLRDLQEAFGLSYVLIAHDLGVLQRVCDRVAIMYLGRIVEVAEAPELYASPLHPYTEALLSAVPRPDPRRKRERLVLQGDLPDPRDPPPGCAFHPRCRHAEDLCRAEPPELREIAPGRATRCHLAEQLSLRGV